MTSLFQDVNSYPLPNAQRNLCGRTHYVDSDTLRFHKARIVSSHASPDGLLFYLIESVALDWDNTRRGFRYVVFNIFGRVISDVKLEDAFRTRAQASKALYAFRDSIDSKEVTREAIARHETQHAMEIKHLRETLAKLEGNA